MRPSEGSDTTEGGSHEGALDRVLSRYSLAVQGQYVQLHCFLGCLPRSSGSMRVTAPCCWRQQSAAFLRVLHCRQESSVSCIPSLSVQ